MDGTPESYQAYTLRLARVRESGVWRATLYSAQSGRRWHFATLEQLYVFLREAVDARAGPEPLEDGMEGSP